MIATCRGSRLVPKVTAVLIWCREGNWVDFHTMSIWKCVSEIGTCIPPTSSISSHIFITPCVSNGNAASKCTMIHQCSRINSLLGGLTYDCTSSSPQKFWKGCNNLNFVGLKSVRWASKSIFLHILAKILLTIGVFFLQSCL